MTEQPRMTKGDRQELLSLVKKRERVMRAQASQRSADLLAEFDAASAKIYHWDDDAIWAKCKEEAESAVQAAEAEIAKRAEALGIPREFAPGISFAWHGRGHNAVVQRRTELRRAAKSRIEAMEAAAIAQIEKLSLTAQTQLLSQALDTDAAKAFLQSMPTMESLMPTVPVADIQALVETTKREQRLSYEMN